MVDYRKERNKVKEERVIVLVAECLTKGVGRHVLDLYENIAQKGSFKVYVVYGEARSDDRFIERVKKSDRMPLKELDGKLGLRDVACIFKLRKIMHRVKPDVVHCHSSKAGFSGRIAAKMCRIKKIVYSPHAFYFLKYGRKSAKGKIFLFAERVLTRHFTDVVVTTSSGEDEVYTEYRVGDAGKKIFVVHGISEIVVSEKQRIKERKSLGVNNENILVGAMARFDDQKNPINTFLILNEISKCDNVKCVFFGSGPKFDEVKALAVDSEVILYGETERPEIDLSALDVYLTASFYEGLPYTLIQCLALGKPVVASDVVGNRDCVEDGVNGRLFGVDDNDDAVGKLTEMIEGSDLSRMGKASYNLYRERYTLGKMIRSYLKIYGEYNG